MIEFHDIIKFSFELVHTSIMTRAKILYFNLGGLGSIVFLPFTF